jgi:hypothetical protein
MATVLSSNPSLSANYVDCLLGCGGVGAMPLRYASNPLVLRPWLVFVLLLGPFPEEQVITNAKKTNVTSKSGVSSPSPHPEVVENDVHLRPSEKG